MLRQVATVLCCVAGALAAVSTATGQAGPPPPRLVNGGAEDGLAGWQGAGFGTIAYGDDIPPRPGGETRVFAAPSDAAIWQDVDVSDLAGAIDQGGQPYSIGGLLGGRAGQSGGARLVAQPLDRAGAALGDPVIAGPPSQRDRQSKTALLSCYANATAPVGMRSVRLTIQAVGHGLADAVAVFDGHIAPLAIRLYAPPGFAWARSDGPGCNDHLEPIASPTPAPAISSLVTMPTATGCGRALRFSVVARWRSRVSSFSVSARGKRIVRSASKPIVIAAPKRRLRVTVGARITDGRRSTATRTYSAC